MDKESVRAKVRKAAKEAVTSAQKMTGTYEAPSKRGFWDANSNDPEPAAPTPAPAKAPAKKAPMPSKPHPVASKPAPQKAKVKVKIKKKKPGFWDPNTND